MALALAEPVAAPVDRDQRHEDDVGKDVRRIERRLQHRPGAGFDGVAGEEAEMALMVGEGWVGDQRAARGGGPKRRDRADLMRQRCIAPGDARFDEQRLQHFGKLRLKPIAFVAVQILDEGLAKLAPMPAQGHLVGENGSV